MPRYWYDRHDIARNAPPEKQELCHRIVAEKKPYFMRYIYSDLAKQYNTYVKNTNRKALREFQLTVDELYALAPSKRTEDQQNFLNYYEKYLPVYDNDCVMNRICHRFEEEFDRYFSNRKSDTVFDYRILRGQAEYTERQYNEMKKVYDDYLKRLAAHSAVSSETNRKDEHRMTLSAINSRFVRDCAVVCPDSEALCNLLLDICYKRVATKQLAWSISGLDIIHNLLQKHDGIISYPTLDPDGELEFGGNRFRIESKRIEVTHADSFR